MPTHTRTSTGTATKVALGIAIGASAAFAAVSLNSSFTQQRFQGMGKDFPPAVSGEMVYPNVPAKIESAEACVQRCLIDQTTCVEGKAEQRQACAAPFDRCISACSGEANEMPEVSPEATR